jgi:beta-phosphoglucomutase
MTDARAVVFDFDGVLADTEGLHLRAFQDAFAPRGWTLDRADYFERYLGYGDVDMIVTFAADANLAVSPADVTAIVADKARSYDRRVASGSVLFDGAAAAIARLGAARYRLAIASGSFHEEIEAILAANHLRHAIGAIIGADDVRRGKPAPDPYAAAVDALGVAPARAVAIEDSQWGLASARAAGLRTIGVTTSHPASALHLADTVVAGLDAITTDLVDSLLGMR